MKRGRGRWSILLLCLILLAAAFPGPARGEEGEAAEITRGCRFQKNGGDTSALYAHDRKPNTYSPLTPKDVLSVRSKTPGQLLGWLYFVLDRAPARLVLRQYDGEGALLRTTTHETACYRLAVELAEGCVSAEITADAEDVGVCEMRVFLSGALPETVALPEPPLSRADFLIVTTHPDDEWIFLGAVYPIYGGEGGLAGTFAYVTTPNIGRVQEAIDSVWAARVPTLPYFLGFPDVDRAAPQRLKDTFREEEVTLSLVRLYRRIKPLVVVSQDPEKGEYGHWQHIITARAALEAARLAQDPAYDPDSARELGTWTVRKVYQHLAEENPIMLDVSTPLAFYGGKTALEVAKRAFEEHRSQHQYVFRPSIGGKSHGDIRYFGLTYTTVGPDTENDMFEHIEAGDLLQAILSTTPTPEPTAEPTATPAPTPEPTPEPTAEPTAEPTPTPTAAAHAQGQDGSPKATASASETTDTAANPAAGTGRLRPWICGAAGLLILLAAGALLQKRRRPDKDRTDQ